MREVERKSPRNSVRTYVHKHTHKHADCSLAKVSGYLRALLKRCGNLTLPLVPEHWNVAQG